VDDSGVRVFHYRIVPNHRVTVSYIRFKGNRTFRIGKCLPCCRFNRERFLQKQPTARRCSKRT
jgi:hypothetical protein